MEGEKRVPQRAWCPLAGLGWQQQGSVNPEDEGLVQSTSLRLLQLNPRLRVSKTLYLLSCALKKKTIVQPKALPWAREAGGLIRVAIALSETLK